MPLNPRQQLLVKWAGIPVTREVVQNIKVEAENKELRVEILKQRGQIGRLLKLYNQQKKESENLELKKEISEKLLDLVPESQLCEHCKKIN